MARVVFVGNFALWRKGTMSDRSLPMARELRRAGHAAALIVPPWDDPGASSGVTESWGVPVLNVPLAAGVMTQPSAAWQVVRATLAARPDVVVCVKPKGHAGLVALLLARSGMRVVVDTDDWEGRGGWASGASPIARAFLAWHEWAALRAADGVTVASRELASLVGRPSCYLPNGTWEGAAGWEAGDGVAVRRELGISDAPCLLLYSRLFEFELGRVVAVLARVCAAVPDARILVVGAGLRGEEERLRSALLAAGIGGRAVLVGWAPRERIPDLLAAGDVALVPLDDTLVNRCRCSVKLLDLMLAGRAIVAERVGQVPEYLADGVSGVLLRSGDGDGLTGALVALLRDGARARALGGAAERDARGRYGWAGQMARVVRAILGE